MRTVLTLMTTLLLCAATLAQTWSMTTTTVDPPLRRENPGAANATHMYVFGGKSGTSGGVVMNDLWEFDGNDWTLKTADGAAGSPPARWQAGITWDWFNNGLIVFGGQDLAGNDLNDVWIWNPVTNTWTDITPAAGSPSARRFTALAFDWVNLKVLMFGGLSGGTTHLNDTWHFDGATWTQLAPMGPQPAIRRQHVMVERSDFVDVIMTGGQDAGIGTFYGDTWQWDGTDWNQIVTANQPAGKVAIDAAYDLQRQRIVIASGNPGPTGSNSEFDSTTNDWIVLPLDTGIYKCTRYFMAYLPATGKTYKVSGQALNAAAPAINTYENGLGLPPAYAGTGEDLVSSYAINGGTSADVVAPNDIVAIPPASVVSVLHESPGGAFVGIGELLVVGSTLPTGTALPLLFPGLHLEPSTAFLVTAPTAGFPALLPPTGFAYSFGYPGGPLSGISLYLQAIVITGTASNAIFASTNAVEMQLQ